MKTPRTASLPLLYTHGIGSLPRPQVVRDLLARRHEPPPGQCRRALDDLALFAIRLQEQPGLDVVGDGEPEYGMPCPPPAAPVAEATRGCQAAGDGGVTMADDLKAPLKQFGDFTADLDAIERDIRERVVVCARACPGHSLVVHQAEWHVRGIVYHCRRLVQCYQEVAQRVADRVVGTEADVVVMYAPPVQQMWFEFYALVSLARITLDTLRGLLAPLFVTEYGHLPKSISGFIEGETDCPVYGWLAEQPTTQYLSDIRNCLVHFRSFATSDNTMIVREGFEEEPSQDAQGLDWLRPMAKGVFRRIGDNGVSVNFYVPDVIFDRGGGGEKLARFTYERRYNVLSQSSGFVNLASVAVMGSLVLLAEKREPAYHYAKPKKPR
jgi:hypothetical protein